MSNVHTDALVDLLSAGARTATILAELPSLEASTAIVAPAGWTALLARLLVALDREAARRGLRVSIEQVREKWSELAVYAGVVDGERVRGAAWLRRLIVRHEDESGRRCTVCGRLTPPFGDRLQWRAPRCERHDADAWPIVSPELTDLSAHARLRAAAALGARGPWRIARTFAGEVWRLPVRCGRHDALVSVLADSHGGFATAAITEWRGGPVRLGAARILAAEARIEAAANAALGLAAAPTSSASQ